MIVKIINILKIAPGIAGLILLLGTAGASDNDALSLLTTLKLGGLSLLLIGISFIVLLRDYYREA